MQPVEQAILNAHPSMFTKILYMDSVQLGMSREVRHFLEKCLYDSSWIVGANQPRHQHTQPAEGCWRQLEATSEQCIQSVFQMRFIKLAWYRAYVQFALSQGWISWSAFDGNLYELMPQLGTLRFEQFLKVVVQNTDLQTAQRIQALILAGLRYDYLCQGEHPAYGRFVNEGYLFLLPEALNAYQ